MQTYGFASHLLMNANLSIYACVMPINICTGSLDTWILVLVFIHP